MAKIFLDIGKFSFLVAGILIITACTRTAQMSESNQNCGALFETIFQDENVSMYIHPEIDNRLPIQLLTQGLCEGDLNGFVYGSKIQFNPDEVKDTAFYLTDFAITGGRISFELKYEVEGIKIIGSATQTSSSWVISELLVVES